MYWYSLLYPRSGDLPSISSLLYYALFFFFLFSNSFFFNYYYVGFQFWAAYVPCGAQYLDAVKQTLEQIDLIKRMVDRYSDYLRLAVDAKGRRSADLTSIFILSKFFCLLKLSAGTTSNKLSISKLADTCIDYPSFSVSL